jgi:hypothetical protein
VGSKGGGSARPITELTRRGEGRQKCRRGSKEPPMTVGLDPRKMSLNGIRWHCSPPVLMKREGAMTCASEGREGGGGTC